VPAPIEVEPTSATREGNPKSRQISTSDNFVKAELITRQTHHYCFYQYTTKKNQKFLGENNELQNENHST
jgi:hypothetical protein